MGDSSLAGMMPALRGAHYPWGRSPEFFYGHPSGPSWSLEGVPEMSESSTKTDSQDRGRFSARRKAEAVLRLLRGEDLDTLSRQLGVTAATLSGWRDAFLDGGTAALKSRPTD